MKQNHTVMDITFENLPKAVSQLYSKLESIEQLLLSKGTEPQAPEELLLTIQQAADLLNLSVPTIYGLVSRSDIPVSKRGRRLYFSKQELLEWVKAGRKKTNSEIEAEAQNYINKRRK
jgi:excisionase family DNA binding protein